MRLPSPPDRLELIRRLNERNGEKEVLREKSSRRRRHSEPQGVRYVAVAARLSADLLAYAEDWLTRLEEELEVEGAGRAEIKAKTGRH